MGLSQLETEERDGSPAAGPGPADGRRGPPFRPHPGGQRAGIPYALTIALARGNERTVRTWSPDGEPQPPRVPGRGWWKARADARLPACRADVRIRIRRAQGPRALSRCRLGA